MKNKLIIKGLVFWTIFLCVIIPIFPTDAVVISKPTTTQINDNGNTNVLCEIRIIWRPFRLKPTVNFIQGQKIFNFTEIGGYVTANFTIICKTWSDPPISVSRWSVFYPRLYKTLSVPERSGKYAFYYQKDTEIFSIIWDNMLMETKGQNISRIVWPAGGGMLRTFASEEDWNITICPNPIIP